MKWWHKYLFASIMTTLIAGGIWVSNHYAILDDQYVTLYCVGYEK
jgi:hypothetical protein